MIRVEFASTFQRHTFSQPRHVATTNVRDALETAFVGQMNLRSYILDDQGRVRPHITVFVNDKTISDRDTQNDPIAEGDAVFVFQALSGG